MISSNLEKTIQKRLDKTASIKDLSKSISQLEKDYQKNLDKSGDIIVLVGDGELNEGSNWESLMVAAHHKLNNLHIFVDFNHSGDRAISLGNLPEKFASFGCDVREIDGHDISKVQAEMDRKSERVKVTIANTIKGFGIREMESNPEWHHKVPNKIQFKAFLEQLS